MKTDHGNGQDQTISQQIEQLEADIVSYDKQIDEAFNEGRIHDLQTISSKKGHAQFKIDRLKQQIHTTKNELQK